MNPQTDIDSARANISALADGELGGDEAARILDAMDAGAARECWHLYHLIGDVLRAPDLGDARHDVEFVSRLRGRLPPQVSVVAPAQVPDAPAAARPAANDGVFRWKMVAGLASFAAVAAIGWGVMGGIGPQAGVGAQLSQGGAPAPTQIATLAAPVPVTVASNPAEADAGAVMLRDARLDELLAAHRQTSGATALGNAAGFLRNATFEGSGR